MMHGWTLSSSDETHVQGTGLLSGSSDLLAITQPEEACPLEHCLKELQGSTTQNYDIKASGREQTLQKPTAEEEARNRFCQEQCLSLFESIPCRYCICLRYTLGFSLLFFGTG
jgi:hypothetical protein